MLSSSVPPEPRILSPVKGSFNSSPPTLAVIKLLDSSKLKVMPVVPNSCWRKSWINLGSSSKNVAGANWFSGAFLNSLSLSCIFLLSSSNSDIFPPLRLKNSSSLLSFTNLSRSAIALVTGAFARVVCRSG